MKASLIPPGAPSWAALAPWCPPRSCREPPAQLRQPLKSSREPEIEQLLKPLLITTDPALFQFAVNVYEHCIQGGIQPAEPPLRHAWLVPGGVYVGQWLWDTTFLTDLLATPAARSSFAASTRITGISRIDGIRRSRNTRTAWWPTSSRLTAGRRLQRQGLAHISRYSQAPLLAWGVERVLHRNHDLELVRQALPRLEAFHNWYWRERDLDGVGLVTVGSYDGVVQRRPL